MTWQWHFSAEAKFCPLGWSRLHSHYTPQKFIGISGCDVKGKCHMKDLQVNREHEKERGRMEQTLLKDLQIKCAKDLVLKSVFKVLSLHNVILHHQAWRKQTNKQHMPEWKSCDLLFLVAYFSLMYKMMFVTACNSAKGKYLIIFLFWCLCGKTSVPSKAQRQRFGCQHFLWSWGGCSVSGYVTVQWEEPERATQF